jgi:3-phenylpropionate/trans-cinnamate dioxygenase ferredoxin reductase subunit
MSARPTVVIAGAGLAATRAAETLRAEGFPGRIRLVGDEPWPPYERPALSKEFLAGSRDETSLLLRRPPFWEEHRIELLLGRRLIAADPVARLARTVRGESLRFDHLVVATGARPRRLPLATARGVHELRTLADARALRADLAPGTRLVVIGGGFVGAEVASTALALGVRVTIVEAATAPVARVLGNEVGRLLADRWRAHGVDVRLQTGVASIHADISGRVESVALTDGSGLRADTVLVAVGVEGARELLPERPATIVHPCGDVVGPGHWTAAAHDGIAAARRILGLPLPAPQPHYVWSDQFGLRLQVVGSPRPSDTIELDGSGDSFAARYLDEHGGLRAAMLANRPAEAAELRRRLAQRALPLAA